MMMSNLNTLYEAARYVEMQEMKEQQHRAAIEAALTKSAPSINNNNNLHHKLTITPPTTPTVLPSIPCITATQSMQPTIQPQTIVPTQQQQQPTSRTIVISSSDITAVAGQQHNLQTTSTQSARQHVIVNNKDRLQTNGLTTGAGNATTLTLVTLTTPVAAPSTTITLTQNQSTIVTTTITTPTTTVAAITTPTTVLTNQNLTNGGSITNNIARTVKTMDDQILLDNKQRRQPPMVFRAATREVHNKLEKHRRAHLKECFDLLKKQLPIMTDEKKTSNLNILHSALKYIQLLKRKELELEHEMERLAREKITAQTRLAALKKEGGATTNGGVVNAIDTTTDWSKLLTDNELKSQTTPLTNGTIDNDDDKKIKILPVAPTTTPTSILQTITPPLTTLNQSNITNTTTSTATAVVPTQTTLSVLPVTYPINQGLILQKVAIVPQKSTTNEHLNSIMSTTTTHFLTTTNTNGKMLPIMNHHHQLVVKPVVVVSTASARSNS